MLETLGTSLQDFARNVRIIDILDVALISIVFYLLLNWLIQSISKRSLIGFLILIGTYIFSRLSGMYLTELLIQALFVVILISLVVVFQSDIRRIVDRIGSLQFFGNRQSPDYSNQTTDVLTEAVSKMAENQTGALIVIRGKEEWDRHIDGGIEMNGKLSTPLLYSIFNPTAPGHDGAVLLEGDQIVRFGTHLPLSKNMGKHSGGTRHAAALGLSEHCDALVVVVSEEQGTISIAQAGKIKKLDSSSDLKNTLDSFWNEHYQAQDSALIEGWKKQNIRTAIASVTLASVLWFAFAYQPETVYRTYSVPIEYTNLKSSNVMFQDSMPVEARVTLSGQEQAFRSLAPSELTISFDLQKHNLTDEELVITQSSINLPNDVQLYDVTPRSLKLEPKDIRQRPVKVAVQNQLPDDLELVSINAETSNIDILAGQSDGSIPDSIATEPVDLSTISESTQFTKELVLPSGITLAEGTPREITITIEVRKQN